MAVLIKNFDMPHDCGVCPMHKIENVNQYVEIVVCKVTGKKLKQEIYYKDRDCDCPLEDIPKWVITGDFGIEDVIDVRFVEHRKKGDHK